MRLWYFESADVVVRGIAGNVVLHFLHKGKIERFKAVEKDRGVGFEFDTLCL